MAQLKKLDLRCSRIFGRRSDDLGEVEAADNVGALIEWVTKTLSLEELNLTTCDITNTVVVPLFQALEHNSTINTLILLHNEFSVGAGWEQSLPRLSNQFQSLTLSQKRDIVTLESWTELKQALLANQLTEMKFGSANGGESAWEDEIGQIDQIMRRNKGLCVARKALETASLRNQAGSWPHVLRHLLALNDNVAGAHLFFATLQHHLVGGRIHNEKHVVNWSFEANPYMTHA